MDCEKIIYCRSFLDFTRIGSFINLGSDSETKMSARTRSACFMDIGSNSDTKISDWTGSAFFIDLGWIGFRSDFLNDNAIIITNEPSGFRPLHSTQTTPNFYILQIDAL